jgi:hypothetical protein
LPELTRFFGIIITMYYNDHSPPHFHAKYVDKQASIRINDGHVIDGNLGARALLLVEEWRILHKAELLDDWSLAQARQPLLRIEPLE